MARGKWSASAAPETTGLWPSAAHECLLRAALAPARAALQALAEWKACSGYAHYEEMDVPTMRMLARAGRRLDADLPDDDWTTRMRGLCRYAWMRDAVRYRHAAVALQGLRAAGVEFVLLKGEALLTGGIVPRDGRRVMGDTDILVHTREFGVVHRVLTQCGWTRMGQPVLGTHKRHALVWTGPSGFGMDVHRRMLPVPFEFVGLAALREGARRCDHAGTSVLLPDTVHLLLLACVNGRKHDGNGPVPFEWVADAWDLLHYQEHPVDWDLLLERADCYDLLFPVRDALAYMRRTFAAPVPAAWLARARRTPLRGAGVRAFEAHAGRPPALRSPRRTLLDLWDMYRARRQNVGRAPTRRGWLAYVARRSVQRGPRALGRAWRRFRAEGTAAFRRQVRVSPEIRRLERRR